MNEMKRLCYLYLFVLLLTSCSSAKDAQSSARKQHFDMFCTAFAELSALPNYKSISTEERHAALLDIIGGNVTPKSDAHIAWDAIQYADAKERYNLFVEAAMASGYEGWQCDEMKAHAHEVGVN